MGRKGRSKGKPSSSKEAVVQKRVDSVGYRPPSARRSQGSAMAATPREQGGVLDPNVRASQVAHLVMSFLAPVAMSSAVREAGAEGRVPLETAGACCLCAGALLGAPPGFLEFLCRVPWASLTDADPPDEDVEVLLRSAAKSNAVSAPHRRALVNAPLEQPMLDVLLGFICMPQVDEFLPPVLKGVGRRGKGSSIWVHPPEQPRTSVTLDLDSPEAPGPSGPALTLTGAAVLLDMATPLHCAALRGLPAAVEQLLMSGADITLTTAAGQLPLELVPRCQWRRGERLCQCQNPSEAILFDGCNVDICRQLLIAQGLVWFRAGLLMWAVMALLSTLAAVGVIFRDHAVASPKLQRHLSDRAHFSRQLAKQTAENLARSIRSEAAKGRRLLGLDTDPDADRPTMPDGRRRVEVDPERAYQCFVRAVHALQRLERQGEAGVGSDAALGPAEQSDLYRLWAESMLVQYTCCQCAECGAHLSQVANMAHLQVARLFGASEAGVEATVDRSSRAARNGIEAAWRGAVVPGTRLSEVNGGPGVVYWAVGPGRELTGLEDVLRDPPTTTPVTGQLAAGAGGEAAAAALEEWCRIGMALSRIVAVRLSSLLETECARPATPAALACVQQALTHWGKLQGQGLAALAGCGAGASGDAARLERWARQAHADIRIAEAACEGGVLPEESVSGALARALDGASPQGPRLSGGATPSRVDALSRALEYHARNAEPEVAELAQAALAAARRELELSNRLSSLLALGEHSQMDEKAFRELEDLVSAAEDFPSLADSMEAGRSLLARCRASQEALQYLRGAMAAAIEQQERISVDLETPGRSTRRSMDREASTVSAPASAGDPNASSSPKTSLPWSLPATPGREPSVLEMADTAGSEDIRALHGVAATLKQAISSVQHASMGVSLGDARKLLRMLQAKVRGVEAFAALAEALQEHQAGGAGARDDAEGGQAAGGVPDRPPVTSRSRLRAAIPGAEAAVQALRGMVPAGDLQAMQARVASAKQRLAVGKAGGGLERAMAAAGSVADLPRLDAAIREVERLGGEGVGDKLLAAAVRMRAEMEAGVRAQQTLYRALLQLKHVDRGARGAAEEAVEAALARAREFLEEEVEGRPAFVRSHVADEVERAAQQLEAWRAAEAAQGRLSAVAGAAETAAEVEAAIDEAAAAGVRVARARKVLRAMRDLEGALAAPTGAPGAEAALEEAIRAARAAGVQAGVVARAEGTLALRQLRVAELSLEDVLRQWAGAGAQQRRALAEAAIAVARARLMHKGGRGREGQRGGAAAAGGDVNVEGGEDVHSARLQEVEAEVEDKRGRVLALLTQLEAQMQRDREEQEQRERERRSKEAEQRRMEADRAAKAQRKRQERHGRIVEAVKVDARPKAEGPKAATRPESAGPAGPVGQARRPVMVKAISAASDKGFADGTKARVLRSASTVAHARESTSSRSSGSVGRAAEDSTGPNSLDERSDAAVGLRAGVPALSEAPDAIAGRAANGGGLEVGLGNGRVGAVGAGGEGPTGLQRPWAALVAEVPARAAGVAESGPGEWRGAEEGVVSRGPSGGRASGGAQLSPEVRSGHHRNSTWTQLEAELLSQALTTGGGEAATGSLSPMGSRLAAWGLGDAFGAGAHRNGPHTPLGSSVGASQGIHDLHSELMQLLMPDGQAASWGVGLGRADSGGDAWGAGQDASQDLRLPVAPFPQAEDVGESATLDMTPTRAMRQVPMTPGSPAHPHGPPRSSFGAEPSIFSSSLFASAFSLPSAAPHPFGGAMGAEAWPPLSTVARPSTNSPARNTPNRPSRDRPVGPGELSANAAPFTVSGTRAMAHDVSVYSDAWDGYGGTSYTDPYFGPDDDTGFWPVEVPPPPRPGQGARGYATRVPDTPPAPPPRPGHAAPVVPPLELSSLLGQAAGAHGGRDGAWAGAWEAPGWEAGGVAPPLTQPKAPPRKDRPSAGAPGVDSAGIRDGGDAGQLGRASAGMAGVGAREKGGHGHGSGLFALGNPSVHVAADGLNVEPGDGGAGVGQGMRD